MQTTDTTIPPEQAKAGDGCHFVLARLTVPLIPGFIGDENRIATLLMDRLLQARLESAAVRVAIHCGTGPFHNSIYILKVNAIAPALASIRESFESIGLSASVQIGWLDTRENILRVVHPAETQILYPHDEIEKISNDEAPFRKSMEDALLFLRNQKPPDEGQQGR